MLLLEAAGLYFALVFSAGFALGILRTLWLAPRFGARRAEIGEAPVMLAVSFVATRGVTAFLDLPPDATLRLVIGSLALVFMLAAEFALVLPLRGLTFQRYFSTRDPVAGAVYYASLVAFALMPFAAAHI